MIGSSYQPRRFYAGVGRQRGSGIGAVALGAGFSALPYLRPLAKRAVSLGAKVGKQFVTDIAPELIDSFVHKRKPRGSRIRKAAASSLRAQIGRGRRRGRVTKRKRSQKISSPCRNHKHLVSTPTTTTKNSQSTTEGLQEKSVTFLFKRSGWEIIIYHQRLLTTRFNFMNDSLCLHLLKAVLNNGLVRCQIQMANLCILRLWAIVITSST